MSTATIPDPANLTNFYFSQNESYESFERDDVIYVHPSIKISTKNVQHGRGMIVTSDISAGTCLFITPPIVAVEAKLMCEKLEAMCDDVSSKKVENVAMDVLEDSMLRAVDKDIGKRNAILALMGNHDHGSVGGDCNDEDGTMIIDVLNGKKNDSCQLDSVVFKKEDMRSIILKNAFGPDYITYNKMECQWKKQNNANEQYYPPHILGIFPLAAMINHSCCGNAVRTYANGVMAVHASQLITIGSEVVWSYIPPTKGFMERRRVLKRNHRFLCKCERCMLESTELSRDILPINYKNVLQRCSRWNEMIVDVNLIEDLTRQQISSTFLNLQETVLGSSSLSTATTRHLRVGFTNLHFNYFNILLSRGSPSIDKIVYDSILNSATHLHFAFCGSNNASTEHVSLLHLCYDISNILMRRSTSKSNTEVNRKRIKFYTEAIKKLHMIRYGCLGSDIEAVRACLVHTRTVLRSPNGYTKIKHNFL